MKPLPKLALGAALAASAAVALSSDLHLERGIASRLLEPPVRVVVVDDPVWLGQTRDAVRDERIVAQGPAAFALEGGRIYATNHAAASELLNARGWGERTIVLGSSERGVEARVAEMSASLTPARVRWGLRGLALVGGAVMLVGAHGLWRELVDRHRRDRARRAAPLPVLVLRMASPGDLAEVRASVADSHIVAEAADAFAVGDGWIVTCSDDGASRLLRRAGWKQRSLEAHRPDPFGAAARRDDWAIDIGPTLDDDKRTWSPREAILALARGMIGEGMIGDGLE